MSPEPAILIFDIGKTNKKYFLINEQYKIVHSSSALLPESADEDGFQCDDIQLIYKWIQQAIFNLTEAQDYHIKAINFSAYGASLVHVDKDGKVLTPLYNYLKPFPHALARELYDEFGGQDYLSLQTASPALGSLNSGLQLYRLMKEQQDTFAQIAFTLHLPQYLSYSVCGKPTSEITSIGCHTLLWDFNENHYHKWVIREELDRKFPALVCFDLTYPTFINKQNIAVGIGLHDSSAALIPYLLRFPEPFVLISTGTWCISLNPFNHAALTISELQQDCLSYLSCLGKPVKASRLFAGQYHDNEIKRIADRFNEGSELYERLPLNELLISEHKVNAFVANLQVGNMGFGDLDLSEYNGSDEAYHDLMLQIVIRQVYATKLVLNDSEAGKIFVDGGFSRNEIYMKLLATFFPEKEVFAACVSQASAIGAALAIHKSWNNHELAEMIDLIKIQKVDPNLSIAAKFYG